MNDFMNIEGWLTLEQGKALSSLSSSLNENAVIVEIGAYRGRSTCFIAYGIQKNKNIKMYSIDICIQEQLISNLDHFCLLDKIFLIEGDSIKDSVIETIPDPIDFLFIDGDHNAIQVYNEFQTYFPKLKKNGILALHDVGPLDSHVPQFMGPYFVYNSVIKDYLHTIFWVSNKKYETDLIGDLIIGFKK